MTWGWIIPISASRYLTNERFIDIVTLLQRRSIADRLIQANFSVRDVIQSARAVSLRTIADASFTNVDK